MKKIFWLATGVAAGLVLAKKLDEDPAAKAKLDELWSKAKDIGAAAKEGFDERSTELKAERKPESN